MKKKKLILIALDLDTGECRRFDTLLEASDFLVNTGVLTSGQKSIANYLSKISVEDGKEYAGNLWYRMPEDISPQERDSYFKILQAIASIMLCSKVALRVRTTPISMDFADFMEAHAEVMRQRMREFVESGDLVLG